MYKRKESRVSSQEYGTGCESERRGWSGGVRNGDEAKK
jgi:hypothetical protein